MIGANMCQKGWFILLTLFISFLQKSDNKECPLTKLEQFTK